ncbi:MAG: hypothetical protein MUC92_01420 [Fimbriimonadaceae bacterium]|nr:hypothetical protein [Fimbriimonadaceae bacterium]
MTTAAAREAAVKPYSGPKWPEWVLSLAVCFLIASLLQTRRQSEYGQTAQRYYFETPGIPILHTIALTLNLILLVSIFLWVVKPVFERFISPLVSFLAFGGILLAWYEVIRATATQPNPIYILQELPYRPVNNLGILGASIFCGYLLFRMPYGFVEVWRSNLIRIGLAVGLFLCQTIAYEFLTQTQIP